MDPYSFWERQKDNANVTNPVYSYNSLFGKMIVTVTDAGGHTSLSFVAASTCSWPGLHRPLAVRSSLLCTLPFACSPRPTPACPRLQTSAVS